MTDDERLALIPFEPHQIEAMEFAWKYRRILIADKMGLGKTLSMLGAGYKRGLRCRCIITCSSSALSVWVKEIKLWFPELASHIRLVEGTKQKRRKLWNCANDPQVIYICTYGTVLSDTDYIPQAWDLHIADEVHKIRNHKAKQYKETVKIISEDLYLSSGTPAKKGVRHMWGYLNWLYPKRYPSYWKFINTFCTFEEGPFGREIVGVQNMDRLKEELSTIMIRRKRTAKGMPPKRRHLLQIEMNAEEQKVYDSLDKDSIYSLKDGTYLLTPSAMATNLRCRQLFTCPQLIDPELGIGSGLQTIINHSDEQELDKFVIFTPFPAAFDFLKWHLNFGLKRHKVFTLRGGMKSTDVAATIAAWENEPQSIMICSILFATSFNLTKASTAYMLGFEWDADDNYQAEDRLHRIGITEDVNIYYLLHDNVLAHKQLQIVNAKYSMGKAMGIYGD